MAVTTSPLVFSLLLSSSFLILSLEWALRGSEHPRAPATTSSCLAVHLFALATLHQFLWALTCFCELTSLAARLKLSPFNWLTNSSWPYTFVQTLPYVRKFLSPLPTWLVLVISQSLLRCPQELINGPPVLSGILPCYSIKTDVFFCPFRYLFLCISYPCFQFIVLRTHDKRKQPKLFLKGENTLCECFPMKVYYSHLFRQEWHDFEDVPEVRGPLVSYFVDSFCYLLLSS